MIGPNLLKVYQEVMHYGSLGNIINKGVITSIPKLGDLRIITNQSPITLLNLSYNIIAKALSLKLRHLLPLIVQPKQTSFIKGYYILNNILAICEGMEWDRVMQQATLFVKIEFQKAYDIIEWNFIISMLKALRFGQYFIHSIHMLF